MNRDELQRYMDALLETSSFRDYCPNGLQVEGKAEVRRLVGGVTASQALIQAAAAAGADALLVHHGWFWKGEDGRVTGFRKQRMAALLAADMSLFAFHLPLDAHPELGNNAQLGKRMGWSVEARFGDENLGLLGRPAQVQTAAQVAAVLAVNLGRTPQLVGPADKPVARIAWCSGGAQDWFEAAVVAGADCFVSGEISEPVVHLAREAGVAYIAAGHHATERYGVQALGAHVAEKFGLQWQFIDIDNPV